MLFWAVIYLFTGAVFAEIVDRCDRPENRKSLGYGYLFICLGWPVFFAMFIFIVIGTVTNRPHSRKSKR